MAGRPAVSDRMRLGAIALAFTAYLSAAAPASAQAPLTVGLDGSSGDRPLISVCRCARPRYRTRTSSYVGIRSPANAGPNQRPASSRRSSSSVCAVTGPEPSVVRSTLSSWMTTTWPSLVNSTSSSR